MPKDTLENVMRKMKNSAPTCFFTAFKINESTDKMFGIMEGAFGWKISQEFGHGFSIADQHLADGFLNTMVKSMISSIEKTRTKSRIAVDTE